MAPQIQVHFSVCVCYIIIMIIIIKDEPASSLQLGLFEDLSESNVAGDYCI